MRVAVLWACYCLASSPVWPAQAASSTEDLGVLETIHQIKAEAFDRSQVMEHLYFLTDVYGPRLTGSPEFGQAAEWARGRLKEFGVANVHAEKWGPFGRSWSLENCTLDMIEPRYSHLAAAPLAWSGTTRGPVVGEVTAAPMEDRDTYDPKVVEQSMRRYMAQCRGKLRGKVVLSTPEKRPEPATTPRFRRFTAAELTILAEAPKPIIRKNITLDQLEVPKERDKAREYIMSLPVALEEQLFERFDQLRDELNQFYRQEGVLAVIHEDRRSQDGLDFAEAAGSHLATDPLPLPTFVVTEEQYGRMFRLAEKKQTVKVRFNLQAKYSDQDVNGENIIGEIPGQKKPDEIVMIGAHFDSWHTGTGTTDNGAGSAVMLEVMRVLRTLNLKLDRTVRIGLWSGEEQGLYGSRAYVQHHFAEEKAMQVKPEHAKLSAYLNLDNGSGKIRGIYLEDNDAARPLFERWLAPFRDLGVTTTTLKHTGGTDHLSFDAVGLPAFQFIQDPLDYSTVTHHSIADTYSHAIPEDLMQASAVIAALVVDIANRPELLPRKPMPSPPVALTTSVTPAGIPATQ